MNVMNTIAFVIIIIVMAIIISLSISFCVVSRRADEQAEKYMNEKRSNIKMNKQIFIINGSGFSGKDSFALFVSEYIPTMNFSSIDKVKEVAKYIGWKGTKTEKDRKFLSDLKLLCTEYNDMPFNSIKEIVNYFQSNEYIKILFIHIREPIEIERAKKEFNAKTILIKRDSIKQITSNMADANVFNYNYDIIINNDSNLENFHEKAKIFSYDFVENKLKINY